jgi:ATP-binding cassette subfamily B protein
MDNDGTSLGDISEAAEIIGLHTLAVKIDYDTMLNEVPYPAMLHWNKNHFVVIYKMEKNKIWIADPAKGYVTYTKEEFLPHWINNDIDDELKEGYALLLETTDSFF